MTDVMEKAKAVLAALEAASKATKTSPASATKAADDEKEAAHKATMDKAADLAVKAHKAVGALNEHMSGIEGDEHKGMKEDCGKVHKAMKSLHDDIHKAAGIEPKGDKDTKEDSTKVILAEAMKTIGGLQAKMEMLEQGTYQPRSAGAGAVLTAAKGQGVQIQEKKVSEMSADELGEARKSALARTRLLPIPADEFSRLDVDTLRAADQVLKLAGQSGDVVAR